MADGGNGPSPGEMGLTQKDLGIDKPIAKPKRPGGPLHTRKMVGPGGKEYGIEEMPKLIQRPDGLRYLLFPDGKTLPEPLTEKKVLESHQRVLEHTTPTIKSVYALMLQENRQLLLQVPMELIDPKIAKEYENTGGCFNNPDQPGDHSKVKMVDGDLEHYKKLLSIRKESVAQVAGVLGISLNKVTPEILSAYIFAHEMGHARDFISNYLQPAKDDWQKANRIWEEDSQKDKANWSLPWNPAIVAKMINEGTLKSNVEDYIQKYSANYPQFIALIKQRINGFNLDYPEDQQKLLGKSQKTYEESRSEKAADDFAASFIKGHWQQLRFD